MSIPYRFMPWARRGLARAHRNVDPGNAPLALHPKVNVGLTLQARQDGAVATAVSGNLDLTLYGPGDILGIDQRLVVRVCVPGWCWWCWIGPTFQPRRA